MNKNEKVEVSRSIDSNFLIYNEIQKIMNHFVKPKQETMANSDIMHRNEKL